jgi:hypothetical protein
MAQKAHHFARLDGKADLVNGPSWAKVHGHIFEFKPGRSGFVMEQ